jgi:hypothetical protein
LLFNPARDARLIEYHARNAANPDFTEVLDRVAKVTWFAPSPAGLPGDVKAAADSVLFEHALGLLADPESSPLVRSAALAWFQAQRSKLPLALSHQFTEFERNPKTFTFPQPPAPPPGQPIGEADWLIQ